MIEAVTARVRHREIQRTIQITKGSLHRRLAVHVYEANIYPLPCLFCPFVLFLSKHLTDPPFSQRGGKLSLPDSYSQSLLELSLVQ